MKKEFSHIKNHGFSVPGQYFDEVESKIGDQIFLEEKSVNQEVFAVPENYFDTVEDKILSQVTTPKTKIIPLFRQRYFKAAMTVAASIALFFALQSIDYNFTKKEDFSTYIIENEHIYLNQYEIAELFDDEKLETIMPDAGLTQDEIIEYLAYFSDDINYED